MICFYLLKTSHLTSTRRICYVWRPNQTKYLTSTKLTSVFHFFKKYLLPRIVVEEFIYFAVKAKAFISKGSGGMRHNINVDGSTSQLTFKKTVQYLTIKYFLFFLMFHTCITWTNISHTAFYIFDIWAPGSTPMGYGVMVETNHI